MHGVTPVGGPNNAEVPDGPSIVFTGAHLKCPCKPDDLQLIDNFHGKRTILCGYCGVDYDLPLISYRWPPAMITRKRA